MVRQIFQEGFGIEEEKQPRLERLLCCLEKRKGGTSRWRKRKWEADQSREVHTWTHSWLFFLTTTLLELVNISLCASAFPCSTLQGPSLRQRQPLTAHKSSQPAPHNPALGLQAARSLNKLNAGTAGVEEATESCCSTICVSSDMSVWAATKAQLQRRSKWIQMT